MSKILHIQNLSKYFQQGQSKINVLSNLNLSVSSCEIIAIVGSSGSGKSTLLQIAGLLDSKYGGDVIYSDKNTKELTQNEKADLRLSKIGFVYQYHNLLNDFCALENVMLPGIIKNDIAIHELKNRAISLLEDLGIGDRASHYPSQLSGGQQQRVAIARAMINKPDIIFADEPTGNLDYLSAEKVFELFINISQNNNLAVIMVTHNQTIAQKCSKIFALNKGELE